MLLHITDFSAEPLHEQIVRQLIDKIIAGDIRCGSELMPVRTMARKQRVSVHTVERAYSNLEREGLIKSKNGAGFYVVPLTPAQKQAIAVQRALSTESPLNIVERFSRQLISVFDPVKLRDIIAENVYNYFKTERTYFILYDDRESRYSLLPAEGFPTAVAVSRQDEVMILAKVLQNPFRIEKRQSAGAQELVKRGVTTVLPLIEGDQLLGILGLTDKSNGAAYTSDELNLLRVLSNQFVTALTTARFYVDALEKRQMEEELLMARQIQADLLPKALPDDETLSMVALCTPSQTVGGDFYDCLPLDEYRWAIVIGDACGSGLPAAMMISQIQAVLHSEVYNGKKIQDVLSHLNRQMVQFTAKNRFVTMFFGVYDIRTKMFDYVSAGHNYPVRVQADGRYEYLDKGGLALGLLDNVSYDVSSVFCRPGDVLFFYTDGLTESMNENDEIFGEARLLDVLIGSRCYEPADILTRLIADIERFARNDCPIDDRTMMIAKVGR